MLIEHDQLCALIPHDGSMCLLEGVMSWDEDSIHCSAISHRDQDNPLRSQDGLSALQGIEYGAQAMAVHGGLLMREQGESMPPGYLAAVKDVTLHVDWLHDIEDLLEIEARRLLGQGGQFMYEFSLRSKNETLVEARAIVMPRPSGEA
jgi:predicted hotdog family 3-hydroxylacyl-ACP dehydratase